MRQKTAERPTWGLRNQREEELTLASGGREARPCTSSMSPQKAGEMQG